MAPNEKTPRKRLKITHNAAAMPHEPNDADNVVMDPDSTPTVAKHPVTPLADADNVSPDASKAASSVPKPKPVLDGIALTAEVRLKVFDHMVAMESTDYGYERDHLGRFVCPIDATGRPPYLAHGITEISGLRQEYLVEVFKRVAFTFTSSESLMEFSKFIRSHFDLDPAQVPHLHIKTSIFHNETFPQGVKFNRYEPTDFAHGMWDKPDEHLRA
ncbi:hypothetical protein NW768_004717 [Fusarium equiseti]|uniref:Uncharacterized protein n=1 Tax=Fusarium equiseti TaxID=61235 RepID=A0ABQ8RH00_FUSEQ|nr:hypothetical protein NW768_004717 [Fusarium equiseti]